MNPYIILTSLLQVHTLNKEALIKEDLRMARHLISEGIRVTHPKYAFLGREVLRSKINDKHIRKELDTEDQRMMRHLKIEGFTVN